ncbi:50S ribosomal protein L32 [bacterium]|nr:50S ribosomal protein L32 [bacterium]
MPVPRRRHSPSLQGRQRAHKKLAEKRYSYCPKCQAVKLPHRMCPTCGFYKDRQYLVQVEK